jgi:integrase/recombinase XerD
MHLTDCFTPFDRYLSSCGCAKNTRESYQRTLRKFEKFLELSDRSSEAEQLKKEDVSSFLAGCEEAGEKRSSVILRLVICKKFFGWLRAEKQIAEDPAAGIPIPKERKRIPRYLSPAQVESLLNQPEIGMPCGLRDRALLELLYSAGLRISEALAVEIGDINYEQGFIYVRNGKGGKPRSVPVGVTALQWLQRYIVEGRKKLEFDCSSLVFLSRSGQQLSRQSAAAAIRSYAAAAGLPEWVCAHALRHACATHMLEGGAKLPYIQEHLGHALLESTRIYLAVRSEELKIVHSNSHPRK